MRQRADEDAFERGGEGEAVITPRHIIAKMPNATTEEIQAEIKARMNIDVPLERIEAERNGSPKPAPAIADQSVTVLQESAVEAHPCETEPQDTHAELHPASSDIDTGDRLPVDQDTRTAPDLPTL